MRKHEAEEEEKKRVEEEKKKAPASPAKKGKAAAPVEDDDASSIRSGIGRLKGKASWIKDSSDVLEQIADRAASEIFLTSLPLATAHLSLQNSRRRATGKARCEALLYLGRRAHSLPHRPSTKVCSSSRRSSPLRSTCSFNASSSSVRR
jgi:hypothetical protein